jgi:DNA ligase-associated metallophosphoesterase
MINARVEWGGMQWLFDHERVAYLPQHQCLLVADLHLGKVEHFRKNGIALPLAAGRTDIPLLAHKINFYGAKRVIFMGDLYHSAANQGHRQLEELMLAFPEVSFELVPGNHDRAMLTQLPNALKLLEVEHGLGQVILCHAPPEKATDAFYCFGHLHPAYQLQSKGRQKLHFPCFAQQSHQLLLPAFGSFKGSFIINQAYPKARVWLCASDAIQEIPSKMQL